MKYSIKLLTLLLVSVFTAVSCSDWVGETDDPIDEIVDDALNNEEQVPFLETGVLANFAQTHDNLSVTVDGLSDLLQFDPEGNSLATFPTYQELDQGDITFDNNSVDGVYANLNETRFLADDLIRRIDQIGNFEDAAVRDQALFTANWVGGISRYWLGSYFGLVPTTKGAPIDNSDIIPRAELYTQAIAKYDEALNYASAAQAKIVNSLKAELYIAQNNYSAAADAIADGALVSGDAPLQSLHSLESTNAWYNAAGPGRTQLNVDPRFPDYISDVPEEANRIEITGFDEDFSGQVITYYYVNYELDSPIDVVTWQEVALMKAEILLDNPAADVGDPGATPLSLINAVRASHNIPDYVGTVDMDVIMEEREKELFATGDRLLDQLRTGSFHLQGGSLYSVPSSPVTGNSYLIVANPWEHLPITSRERNNNPNFN
ncbi:hypothetical protein [Gracilimonas sp.]|uniref:hypothetical protein n=1 Tax=Gracilimonas sp. TaxID=1974203 RepID=UPI0032EF3B9D